MTFGCRLGIRTVLSSKAALTDATPAALQRHSHDAGLRAARPRPATRGTVRRTQLAAERSSASVSLPDTSSRPLASPAPRHRYAFITGLVVFRSSPSFPRFVHRRALTPAGMPFHGAQSHSSAFSSSPRPRISPLHPRRRFCRSFFINLGDILTFGCSIGFAFPASRPRSCFTANPVPTPRYPAGRLCTLFMAVSLPFIEHPHVHFAPS